MLGKIININGNEINLKFGMQARKKYQEKFGKKFSEISFEDDTEISNLIYAGQTDTNHSIEAIDKMIDEGEKPYIETATQLLVEVSKAINLAIYGTEEAPKSETAEDETEKN